MANDANLIIRISGDSKRFRAELDKIEKQSDASVRRMQKSARIAAAGFVVLAAGAGLAFKQFADFEQKFTDVVTLLDEGSFATKTLTEGIDDLKDGILTLRRETGESFDNLNKGLFDLISAGVDASDAIDTLRVATNLALAGATNTSVAVDGLTSALNAFELSADDAQAVSEKFFTAQKFGKTTVEELSRGFGLVASTANSFGVSLDELLASVAAVTTGGIRTSQAYTGLAAIFANITKPTKDATDEAKRLGIEFSSTALRVQGLQGFLDSITQSAAFSSTSLENLFGSVEAVKTILALTGSGADDFTKILKALDDETQTATTFQEALAVKTNTAAQRMRLLKAGVDAAAVSIGADLAPAILFLAETTATQIGNIIEGFKALGNIIKGLTTISTEAFNIVLSQMDGFVAGFLTRLKELITGIEFFANKVPGITVDFSSDLDALDQQIDKFEQKSIERQKRALDFFTFGEESKLDVLRQRHEDENTLLEAHFSKQAEIDERNRERELEVQAERDQADKDAADLKREEQLEKEQEEFDEDAERLTERLEKLTEIQSIFAGQDLIRDLNKLKQRAKNAKDAAKIDEQLAIAQQKFSQDALNSSLDDLATLIGQETAVGKAIFLIRKAQAIAATIVSTQEAVALARATVAPPGGDIVAARYAIAGAINVAIIGATALQGLSAQEGGVVPGGFGGGDRVPFLLEPGELIVPQNLNPLSPNFDESTGGGLGGQEVNLTIDLTDEASRFITIGQREDATLGVQR